MKKEADMERSMQIKREQYYCWIKSATEQELRIWLAGRGCGMKWLAKEVRPEMEIK